jgi:hypothetical protein
LNESNAVFVNPGQALTLTPQDLTGIASAAIIILEKPDAEVFTVNKDNSVTFEAPVISRTAFFSASLVYVYKDLSGELLEQKREFVVAQQGDVPSIIQTGDTREVDENQSQTPSYLLALTLLLFFITLFSNWNRRKSND